MSTRRAFLNRAAAALTLFRSVLKILTAAPARAGTPAAVNFDCEYIVVGSGAGGGTVAARLAEHGHKVLLLEAGGDPFKLSGGNALKPDQNTLPEDYQVPAFHPNSSENAALKWDFFVRHYSNTEQQKRDHKYCQTYEGEQVDGVLYPRAGTRRMHCPQRPDPGISAQSRLAGDRECDVRSVLVTGSHAQVFREARKLSPPSYRSFLQDYNRAESNAARIWRLAAHRECGAFENASRRQGPDRDH